MIFHSIYIYVNSRNFPFFHFHENIFFSFFLAYSLCSYFFFFHQHWNGRRWTWTNKRKANLLSRLIFSSCCVCMFKKRTERRIYWVEKEVANRKERDKKVIIFREFFFLLFSLKVKNINFQCFGFCVLFPFTFFYFILFQHTFIHKFSKER